MTDIHASSPADVAVHLSAARMHHMAGELAQAEAAYRAALDVNPNQFSALLHLGQMLLKQRRSAEARTFFERVAKRDPGHGEARYLLGVAHSNLGQAAETERWYRECLRVEPTHAGALQALGVILGKLGRSAEAGELLSNAVALQPRSVNAHLDLGNWLYQRGERQRAFTHFRTARDIQPVFSVPAAGKPAFSVLFLWAPGVANTPVHYLTEAAPFDAHFALIVGDDDDAEHLRKYGDIVVNLLSDVDQSRAALRSAEALVTQLNKPIVNHPAKIFATGRDAMASALRGIPGCRVPSTSLYAAKDLAAMPSSIFAQPFLARVAGTHGGNDFELINDRAGLDAFAAAHPEAEFYLSTYVDYRSADGYFRKYRAIFIDGTTVPYHLAIGSHWKVHHFRTQMGSHSWMQQEEQRFLEQPGTVLTPSHVNALDAVARTLDLEFCGVDFAIDRDGALVIFEANASMLVQPDDLAFGYKLSANTTVKSAFTAMLAKAVAR